MTRKTKLQNNIYLIFTMSSLCKFDIQPLCVEVKQFLVPAINQTERQHIPVWLQAIGWIWTKHHQWEEALPHGSSRSAPQNTWWQVDANCYSGRISSKIWLILKVGVRLLIKVAIVERSDVDSAATGCCIYLINASKARHWVLCK